MSIAKVLLGAARQVPQTGETGWGAEVTQILVDLIDSNNITVQKLASGSLGMAYTVAAHAALSAVTAVAAGEYDEQQLELVGTHDTNTVEVPDAGIMDLNGLCVLKDGTRLNLAWDDGDSLWREKSRNN